MEQKEKYAQEFAIQEFPGLYESNYYHCDTICNYLNGVECDYGQTLKYGNEWDIDKESYINHLCPAYVSYIQERYEEIFGKDLFTLTYKKLNSPQFYNFETDVIIATLESNDIEKLYDVVRKKMDEHKEELKTIIYENHTSRSGFISWMDNDIENWYNLIEDISRPYLECVMSYIAKIEGGDLDEDFFETVYIEGDFSADFFIAPQTDRAIEEYESLLLLEEN